MTIQSALMLSRNVPAVKALDAAGLDYARSFLSGLGINYPEMHYSNAISSNNSSSEAKYGASSEKMAAAYAAFANGGIYYKPQYVNKIEFSDGTSKVFEEKGKRAMKETTAYMMTDMLKTVLTYGTGTAAAILELLKLVKQVPLTTPMRNLLKLVKNTVFIQTMSVPWHQTKTSLATLTNTLWPSGLVTRTVLPQFTGMG